MNNVVLIGRLVREPDLRFVASTGMAVTKFTVAVNREMSRDKKQEAEAQGRQTADFIGVTVFGKMAENCVNYLGKGSQCAVHGRIQTGSYTKDDGTKIYTTDVIADRVEFLGSKKETSNTNIDDELPDIFQPVDPDEDIPF